ncbi:MAG: LytTR family transcriptional regulator DNA-binding domain-containing protein [Sphingomonas sp.]|nr:LytTR family transcriptional regulator DNA-binding domain-containing protein [Sphingomonas sp.]
MPTAPDPIDHGTPAAPAARQLLIDLAVMIVIGLVLALIGPFGTFAAPFAVRLVYWLGLSLGGYLCYRPIAGFVARLGPRLDLPDPPLWIAGCLIGTVPMTAIVWIVSQYPGPWRAPTLNGALVTYGSVLVIGAAVMALFYFINRGRMERATQGAGAPIAPADAPEMTVPEAAPARPRFLDRLPPRLGADLVALEMEDHYVRAHTRMGSDLILMRMRDAVAELDGVAGAQVHRSWWVARDAIERVTREGRAVRLHLAGGIEAPVSRAQAPVLEAAGWW